MKVRHSYVVLVPLLVALGCSDKDRSSSSTTTAPVTSTNFANQPRIGTGSAPLSITGVAPGVTARTPSGGGTSSTGLIPGQVSYPNSGGTTSASGTVAANVGSRFWHVDDTLSNPLKVHSVDQAALALEVVNLLNQERAKQGLPAMQADSLATRTAKAHSEDMLGRNFFDHLTPEGWTPVDRYTMLGGSGQQLLGENLVAGAPTAAQIVDVWMNSAPHRANVLKAGYDRVGVGVAGSRPYVTAVFVQR